MRKRVQSSKTSINISVAMIKTSSSAGNDIKSPIKLKPASHKHYNSDKYNTDKVKKTRMLKNEAM